MCRRRRGEGQEEQVARELPEGPVALGPGGVEGGICEDAGDRSVSRCSRGGGSCLSSP